MFEGIDLFSSLSKEELSTLEMFCQERVFSKWEILFNEWEEATAMYILKTWLLEVYNNDKVIWVITPWDFVWEMAIFSSDKRRTASVKAIEDSTVIVLLSFSITDLSNKHPEIMEKIKKVIKQRKLQNENSETLRKN